MIDQKTRNDFINGEIKKIHSVLLEATKFKIKSEEDWQDAIKTELWIRNLNNGINHDIFLVKKQAQVAKSAAKNNILKIVKIKIHKKRYLSQAQSLKELIINAQHNLRKEIKKHESKN